MKHTSIRLVSLNTWCGRSLYPLMTFFRKKAESVDIFCLQEVCNGDQEVFDLRHPDGHICGSLFNKISKELRDFEGSFAFFDDDPHRMSLALFWRRGLPVKTIEDFIVYTPEVSVETGSAIFSPRKLQSLTFEIDGRDVLVANYHGLWNAGPKTDTPERVVQSETLRDFLHTFNGPKVLCGDFNLLPDTESVRILEDGMRNLVKEHKVESTRTVLYRHYENPDEPNFADYVFVSKDVAVKKFEVLPDIVSDHSPLYVEFDLNSEPIEHE